MNDCRGCHAYQIIDYLGEHHPHCHYYLMPNVIDNCPCRKCLVKVICTKACDIFASQCEKDEKEQNLDLVHYWTYGNKIQNI